MKSLKKVICIFIALMLLLAAPAALAIAAPEDMSTKNVLLIEAETGTVLYEKNADMQAKPASTTKIMTCILALENGNLDDIVTVPSVTSSGSTMGIRRGEKMSLRSLIYGMMLVSGNDAAEAVAVHIGGTKDDFVKMMNEKAQSLGMTGTNFVAPSGLEKEEHYTTARDFARLAQYAMYESPQKNNFRIIVNTKTYTVKDSSSKVYELITTNRLLYTSETGKSANVEYKYAIGVKTGMTPASLECLVSAAEKNGVTLILVQFGEPDSDTRFKLAAELFEYGFENYVTRDASALNLASTVEVSVQNASMENGETGLLALNVQFENQPVNCLKADWDRMMNDSSAITSTIIPVGEIAAPIEEGDLVATVAYKYEGKTLFTVNAYASRQVHSMLVGPNQTAEIGINDLTGDKEAGPWLFIILVLIGIAVLVGAVLLLRNRNQRKRRRKARHRHTGAYRGRQQYR